MTGSSKDLGYHNVCGDLGENPSPVFTEEQKGDLLMVKTCPTCGQLYNDSYCIATCPHAPVWETSTTPKEWANLAALEKAVASREPPFRVNWTDGEGHPIPSPYEQQAMKTSCDQSEAMRAMDPAAGKILHGLIGLMGELGELAGHIQKVLFYRNAQWDRTNVIEELGDCFWYLNLCCSFFGVTFEEVQAANLRKLTKRYPGKFDLEASKEENRDREAEKEEMEARERAAEVCEALEAKRPGNPFNLG